MSACSVDFAWSSQTLFHAFPSHRSRRRWGPRRRINVSCNIFLFLLALTAQTLALPARAEHSKDYYRNGKKAELQEDYITAYQDYRQAWLQKPEDMQYKESYLRLKFQAASQYVDMGNKLRERGQLSDALTDFLRALEIDPSDEAAQQEAVQIRSLIHGSSGAKPNPDAVPIISSQADQELEAIRGPIQLKPLSDEPITIHMVADAKVIYETIGKLAGLNVVFDPDYTSKRIQINFDHVSLFDALRTVTYVSQTFWTPIDSNTILIAADTRQKRAELEQQAVQTFYLGNITTANDLNEVLNSVRNLMDTSVKMQAVPSQNAIVMRGTPAQLLLAQKIINDLDRAKPEVVVDVSVLEVNKDLLRNIGLQLPGSIAVQLQSSTASTSSSTTSTTSTSTTGTTSSLTLNDLGNINATNFGITVGAATLNMLLTDADTRVLQNPQIRVMDGEKATLKIGEKIPIATGSFASTATSSVSPLVSTQFSFIDVGVNMEIQPTIHYDGDVSMKVHVVVSNVVGYTTIDSISQPDIGQQDLQEDIRAKEGTYNLLGGILEHSKSLTIAGTPGLGEIPILKYLFSSQETETVNDEIVFLLVPHLVRRIDITPLNLRAVDTGTGTNVTLLMNPTSPGQGSPGAIARSAGTAANREATTTGDDATGPNSSSIEKRLSTPSRISAEPANSSEPQLRLSIPPLPTAQKVGSTFQVKVNLTGGKDIFSVPMRLHYDPQLLSLRNVDNGTLLTSDGVPPVLVHRDDGEGDVMITASRPPGTPGVIGSGDICTLTFQAKAPGDSSIQIIKSAARNTSQTILPVLDGPPMLVHIR